MSDEFFKNIILTSCKMNALEKTLINDSNRDQYSKNYKAVLKHMIEDINHGKETIGASNRLEPLINELESLLSKD